MIVARPQDQKAVPLQPFSRRRTVHDDAWQGAVRSLCDPAPDEAVERLELWSGRHLQVCLSSPGPCGPHSFCHREAEYRNSKDDSEARARK